jgi:hypothetical protein
MATAQVTTMRAHATNIIADNPSVITITRRTYAISGSKRTSTTANLAAQTVRVYGKNRTDIQREGDNIRFGRRREVRMFCVYNANVLPHGPANEDTFVLGGLKYLVKDVREITWNGEIVSKQCTLEERQ